MRVRESVSESWMSDNSWVMIGCGWSFNPHWITLAPLSQLLSVCTVQRARYWCLVSNKLVWLDGVKFYLPYHPDVDLHIPPRYPNCTARPGPQIEAQVVHRVRPARQPQGRPAQPVATTRLGCRPGRAAQPTGLKLFFFLVKILYIYNC